MVVVANVDNGGGSLLLGRVVGRWAAASLRSLGPPSFPTSSPSPLALPPSLLFSGSPALSPFSPLPREDIKKPTMESAGDGEERKGDGAQRV